MPPARRTLQTRLALLLLAAAATPACRADAPNLLAGRPALQTFGVPVAGVITDGRLASEGDDWSSSPAIVFEFPAASVSYDLGQPTQIGAATLQGDNNDEYVLSLSDDGETWRELWVAAPVGSPGLRTRATDHLDGRGRYLKLTARGGDSRYSVSELQVFERPPLRSAASEGGAERVRTRLLFLVVAFAFLLWGPRAGGRRLSLGMGWAAVALAAAAVASAVPAAWPLGGTDLSFLRAVSAAIVLLALWRAAAPAGGAPVHRPAVIAACAAGAVLAFACFYNLGRPQFWHHEARRPLFAHTLDMRVYQPFVKYYRELGYDGVYVASVLAYAEDERGGDLASLATVEIRDQRDHRMRHVSELVPEIRGIRARFSDARWSAFKQDMAFFRRSMGPAYLTSITDHGANAPPAWVLLAEPILGHVTASETSLWVGGMVDAVALLAMAVALAVSFGTVPALATMTVFGATELAMFGSNWGGATLRHEWIVLLGFAAAALRRRRFATGGVLLGAATMLRLLPAFALVGVALVPVGAAWAAWRRGERPTARRILADHPDVVRVLVAAAASMLVVFLASGLVYSFAAWGQWVKKVVLLNADPAVNEVGLRALIVGTDGNALDLLRARRPLFLAAQLGALVIVVRSLRGKPLHQAMLHGLTLLLVFSNPVNYHAQALCLLVLLAPSLGILPAAAPLLGMCVAGYWAALDPDPGRRFQLLTVLLFAALAWLYAAAPRTRTDATTAADSR